MKSSLDVKSQLPKFGGIDQPDYISKSVVQKKQNEEEDIQDSIAFKIAMQEAMSPPIDMLLGGEGKGGSNSHATMAQLISQAEQATEIKNMAKSVKELTETTKKAQSIQALAMHGKEVSYDDSIRTVDKDAKEVNFKYDLRYGSNVPEGTKANVNITILNEKGDVVYSTKQNGVKGPNQYKWDGRGSDGKRVEPGDYKINVSASFPQNTAFGSVEATTAIKGVVESVKISDGKTILRVNGENIDFDQIIEIGGSPAAANRKPSVHEMMNYVHKEVDVDISKIFVDSGTAEILYNNKVGNPGKVRVDFFGANSEYIKTVNYAGKLQQGVGSFTINAKKEGIADGEYTVKVVVEDKDNKNSYVTLSDTKVAVTVESIDVANAKLRAGGLNYDARSVENIIGESNLYTLGAQFVGKRVQYVEDKFKFTGPNYNFLVPVEQTPAGRVMGEAELRVFKNGKREAIVNINPIEPTAIPAYDNLDVNSKAAVNNLIKSEFQTTRRAIPYNQLVGDQKRLIDRFIALEFRAGKMFAVGQNPADQATKDQNMGIGGVISWDGRMDGNKRAVDGEEFTYELWTSTTAADGSDLQVTRINPSASGFVAKPIIENNTLLLELRDGSVIPYTNVEAIG